MLTVDQVLERAYGNLYAQQADYTQNHGVDPSSILEPDDFFGYEDAEAYVAFCERCEQAGIIAPTLDTLLAQYPNGPVFDERLSWTINNMFPQTAQPDWAVPSEPGTGPAHIPDAPAMDASDPMAGVANPWSYEPVDPATVKVPQTLANRPTTDIQPTVNPDGSMQYPDIQSAVAGMWQVWGAHGNGPSDYTMDMKPRDGINGIVATLRMAIDGQRAALVANGFDLKGEVLVPAKFFKGREDVRELWTFLDEVWAELDPNVVGEAPHYEDFIIDYHVGPSFSDRVKQWATMATTGQVPASGPRGMGNQGAAQPWFAPAESGEKPTAPAGSVYEAILGSQARDQALSAAKPQAPAALGGPDVAQKLSRMVDIQVEAMTQMAQAVAHMAKVMENMQAQIERLRDS